MHLHTGRLSVRPNYKLNRLIDHTPNQRRPLEEFELISLLTLNLKHNQSNENTGNIRSEVLMPMSVVVGSISPIYAIVIEMGQEKSEPLRMNYSRGVQPAAPKERLCGLQNNFTR